MSKALGYRVSHASPLPSPGELLRQLPLSPSAAHTVHAARRCIGELLAGNDERLLVVVGPCSVHDPDAALEYATRLRHVSQILSDRLLIVMRVYFEKPRTTVGWKGLINDPHLDGSEDIGAGLRLARKLLLEVADLGVPAATELLDPIAPQYISDLVSWAAIGARTTESQTHREMASGLSMPVGFKNGTDGSLDVAINAMLAAAQPHSFLGIDATGRVAKVRTLGNSEGHLVMRGGTRGPNYRAGHVSQAADELRRAGLQPRLLIDCAHGNSGKCIEKQVLVAKDVAEQVAAGSNEILGSHVGEQLVPRSPRPGESSSTYPRREHHRPVHRLRDHTGGPARPS